MGLEGERPREPILLSGTVHGAAALLHFDRTSRDGILPVMLQIIFSEVGAQELAAMPRKLQLELIDGFQVLPRDFEKADEKFGQLTRGGRRIYRYRVKDYRIYFEKRDDIVYVRCVLNKNSLKDFFFRSKLPISEDQLLQDNPKFWELLEGGTT